LEGGNNEIELENYNSNSTLIEAARKKKKTEDKEMQEKIAREKEKGKIGDLKSNLLYRHFALFTVSYSGFLRLLASFDQL
jgi:hypothetical protein